MNLLQVPCKMTTGTPYCVWLSPYCWDGCTVLSKVTLGNLHRRARTVNMNRVCTTLWTKSRCGTLPPHPLRVLESSHKDVSPKISRLLWQNVTATNDDRHRQTPAFYGEQNKNPAAGYHCSPDNWTTCHCSLERESFQKCSPCKHSYVPTGFMS